MPAGGSRPQLYIEQPGDDAIVHAPCADEMLDTVDLDGRAVWQRVMEAIKELQGAESSRPVFEFPNFSMIGRLMAAKAKDKAYP